MTGQLNGTCACGCGMTTNIAKYDYPEQGIKAGQHRRFVNGHYHQMMRRICPGHGQQYQREELRHKRRGQLVQSILESGGMKSLQQIGQEIAPEFNLCAVSRIVNTAREWGYYGNIPAIMLRMKETIRPLYDRPEIAYEKQTEIYFLTKSPAFDSLDAVPSGYDATWHDRLSGNVMSPLEILLLREEQESEEYHERQRRIDEWQKWESTKHSAFAKIQQVQINSLVRAQDTLIMISAASEITAALKV